MDRKYKTVHLGVGVDLLGSAMSLNIRAGNELKDDPNGQGILAFSKKTGRQVFIPWANIRGAEVIVEAPQQTKKAPK